MELTVVDIAFMAFNILVFLGVAWLVFNLASFLGIIFFWIICAKNTFNL